MFVEQLWVPALKAGVIDSVQDILKALNHSLTQWEAYLTAVCRYLSQRSLYHILYQTQLYMRVSERVSEVRGESPGTSVWRET